MFSKVFSSYDFRIEFFFFVLECFQETLCIFIFLLFVHLYNRGTLFRTSEGVLLLSDSFTPLVFHRLRRPWGDAQSCKPRS